MSKTNEVVLKMTPVEALTMFAFVTAGMQVAETMLPTLPKNERVGMERVLAEKSASTIALMRSALESLKDDE